MPRPCWLSPEILTWDINLGASTLQDPHAVQRAYQHWQHAESLLPAADDEFRRIDVITTLKRAVDYRLRLLNDYYRWKRIGRVPLPKGSLQTLEALGVARHSMVNRLVDLRNRIEHADEEPPSQDECSSFVELVWYFLRATDLLVVRVPSELELEPCDESESYALTIRTGPTAQWETYVDGTVAARHVSDAIHDDGIRVRLTLCESRDDWLAEPTRSEEVRGYHEGRDRTDLFIEGVVDGPRDYLLRIYRELLQPR
jgi:hypothetical protein